MKRITALFIVLFFLFLSCKQKINYNEDIQGEWLCQEIMNPSTKPLIIPTNNAFVVRFNNDASLCFSKGYELSNSNEKRWMENKNFTYTIEENKLLVKGRNTLGQEVDLSLTIEQLTSKALTCKENYYKINGEEKGEERTFYFTKIYKDYTQKIIGFWEVRKIAKFEPDTFAFAKYLFAENNKLNIEQLNNEQQEAHYFLNGELLSINQDNNYHCWLIYDFSTERILMRNWQTIPGSFNLQGITYELRKIN